VIAIARAVKEVTASQTPELTSLDLHRLHLPDEPDRRALMHEVEAGIEVDEVLGALEQWLWARWRLLETTGMDRAAFGIVVGGYRRELWLWIVGERTWPQCCSGLIGRIGRRART